MSQTPKDEMSELGAVIQKSCYLTMYTEIDDLIWLILQFFYMTQLMVAYFVPTYRHILKVHDQLDI